jgi:hypothetical protein
VDVILPFSLLLVAYSEPVMGTDGRADPGLEIDSSVDRTTGLNCQWKGIRPAMRVES